MVSPERRVKRVHKEGWVVWACQDPLGKLDLLGKPERGETLERREKREKLVISELPENQGKQGRQENVGRKEFRDLLANLEERGRLVHAVNEESLAKWETLVTLVNRALKVRKAIQERQGKWASLDE